MDRHNNINILRRNLFSVCCVGLGLVFLLSDAQARIKYGLWEISIHAQMDVMPTESPQEVIQKCISKEDLTPGNTIDKDGCDQSKVTRKGDIVNWTVSCSRDEHSMTGNGLVVYSGNTLTGNAQFQAGGKGLVSMKMKLLYKEIGRAHV